MSKGIEVVDDPPLVSWLLNGVDLGEGISVDQIGIAYDGQTSLNMLAREAGGKIALLGWLANTQTYDLPPRTVSNATSLEDLPTDLQRLDIVGKGVGSRLYNTPNAALGAPVGRSPLGLYAAEVSPTAVMDTRAPADHRPWGKLYRIAQHAGKIAALKIGSRSLEDIIDRVHEGYGAAEAVIWGQPPHALLRQYSRGGKDQVLAPTFAIIRRAEVLRRTGVQIVE